MKKMKSIILIIVILTAFFASCSSKEYRSEPKASPTSTPQKVHSVLKDKSVEQESTQTKAAFEKLREVFKQLVEKSETPDRFPFSNLENFILSSKEDSIIIASRLSYDSTDKYRQLRNDEIGENPFNSNDNLWFVVVDEFTLDGNKLIEKGSVVPVKYTFDTDTNEILKVVFPEPYDKLQREMDAQDMLGHGEHKLGFMYSMNYLSESNKIINKVIYNAAINGGFDKFPNDIVTILNSLYYYDKNNTSDDSIIRQELIKLNFSYNSITIPFCYVLYDDKGDRISKYILQSNYTISSAKDGSLYINTIPESYPTYIYENSNYEIICTYEWIQFYGDDKSEVEIAEIILREHADKYFAFKESEEYSKFTAFCEDVISRIIDGSFDYTNDSLTYTK